MNVAGASIEARAEDAAAVRAARVAAIASKYADEVGAEGRCPREAVDGMRGERELSIQMTAEMGGEGG
ncbi:hypothetical protein [Rhizobium sp. SEMIA 4085]|uniref:hypothetical protein n=1 Tax=Rhizobium sp. SEMIA 4085 TaxID=2137761 RepID=UPI001FEE2C4C|nr:hypothetical protein [Rhizobium sp. SEMIA 4085]